MDRKTTSGKVDGTDKLLEELLRFSGPFRRRKHLFEPVADDPLLLGVLLRRGVDQEDSELEAEVRGHVGKLALCWKRSTLE